MCLGENAPPLLSVSQVTVCMNCPTHFSLTNRRHHCHACGKVQMHTEKHTNFHLSTLNILKSISNFAATCQKLVIRVLLDSTRRLG